MFPGVVFIKTSRAVQMTKSQVLPISCH